MLYISQKYSCPFDYQIIHSIYDNSLAINLKINNSDNRSETPFASIIIMNIPKEKAKIETELILEKLETWCYDSLYKRLNALSLLYGVSVLKKYETESYDNIISRFPSDIQFYNVLCVIDGDEKDVSKTYHDILITFFPLYGKDILQPIRKSPNFSLYNGKFISSKKAEINKCVFLMVDIRVSFSYAIVYHGDDDDLIEFREYSIFRDKKEKGKFCTSVNKLFLPIHGREFLLRTKRKNLFRLESVPDNIIVRKNGTIEVKSRK